MMGDQFQLWKPTGSSKETIMTETDPQKYSQPYIAPPFLMRYVPRFGWREVSPLFPGSMLTHIKVNPENSAGPSFIGFRSYAEVFMSHSVHTQIWKLHLIDWDRLVLGMPRSNGQCSRWTRRRAVNRRTSHCQQVHLKAVRFTEHPNNYPRTAEQDSSCHTASQLQG